MRAWGAEMRGRVRAHQANGPPCRLSAVSYRPDSVCGRRGRAGRRHRALGMGMAGLQWAWLACCEQGGGRGWLLWEWLACCCPRLVPPAAGCASGLMLCARSAHWEVPRTRMRTPSCDAAARAAGAVLASSLSFEAPVPQCDLCPWQGLRRRARRLVTQPPSPSARPPFSSHSPATPSCRCCSPTSPSYSASPASPGAGLGFWGRAGARGHVGGVGSGLVWCWLCMDGSTPTTVACQRDMGFVPCAACFAALRNQAGKAPGGGPASASFGCMMPRPLPVLTCPHPFSPLFAALQAPQVRNIVSFAGFGASGSRMNAGQGAGAARGRGRGCGRHGCWRQGP